jgi:hypothetical protein
MLSHTVEADEFEQYVNEARTDRDSFPDEFQPEIGLVAARNAILNEKGGSMGPIESIELTPVFQNEDGVLYAVTVVQEPGKRSIPTDVSAIAGHAGLKVNVLESGELDNDMDADELDDDELPRLTYRLVR